LAPDACARMTSGFRVVLDIARADASIEAGASMELLWPSRAQLRTPIIEPAVRLPRMLVTWRSKMNQRIRFLAAITALAALPAVAALKAGDPAPDFKAQASLAGAVFTFSLAEELKKGPVVLYFYPAAFTTGCTTEAHDFADAVDTYRSLGASVIGVSHDDIGTLNKFSVSECRSKFAVAADKDQSIMKSYDAVLALKPEYADRVSYVISPDGRVVFAYKSLSPEKHVEYTLEALRKWSAQQGK
jgi:thioredoxin-dependent peroxiredoxin